MDFFTSLPTTVVVDHMGRPDVTKPIDGPEFELFLKFMAEHPNVWSKVSCPERLSTTGPQALNGEQNAYRDVVPFARRVVEEFPDRVLWGTDWPHPNLKGHMPDDGLLVDFIPHIAPTAELQKKLLWTTPCASTGPKKRPRSKQARRTASKHLTAQGDPAMALEKTVHGRARHDHLRRRAEPQRLLAQPVSA